VDALCVAPSRITQQIFAVFTRDSILYAIPVARIYAIARPSVCPSVRRVDHTRTVEARIMKISPYGSPIHLVFAGKFHPEILRVSPERRRQKREGWVKLGFFYL